MKREDEAIEFIGEFNFVLFLEEIDEGQLSKDYIQQIGIAMDRRVNRVFKSKFQDCQEELPKIWLKMSDKLMDVLVDKS
jgi:hypothetical protein